MLKLVLLGATLFGAGFLMGWWRRLAAETVGERSVRRRLTEVFRSQSYHLLNSVTLRCPGGTTQIDHILVSRFGVVVIEGKHYTGWIFADAKSASWMQIVYKVRNQFPNPIRQNFKHVQAVKALLDNIPASAIHSAVVFTGDAEFRTPMPNGVFTTGGLVNHIAQLNSEVISEEQLRACVGRLECARFALTRETDVEHQANLANRFGRELEDRPELGGALIVGVALLFGAAYWLSPPSNRSDRNAASVQSAVEASVTPSPEHRSAPSLQPYQVSMPRQPARQSDAELRRERERKEAEVQRYLDRVPELKR